MNPVDWFETLSAWVTGVIFFSLPVGETAVPLIVVWLIFRIVFTVLMPAGIVPEGEIIQVFRNLIGGGNP